MRLPPLCFALLTAAALPLWAGAAHAQGTPGQTGFHPMFGTPKRPTNDSTQQPAALPGAANNTGTAEKTIMDLPPTEALFDAVNRGDMASAKDAISRGADLSARNVLGMTPLDLSIDLSRNDITFLLLGMRTQEPASTGPATKSAKAKPAGAAVLAATPAKRPPAKPPVVAAAKPMPAVPRQYAGPGAADPQAGFLGFGAVQ